jgi:solute carrier family 1 (neuronal/epithelial high affinity glutamate transporter), member 1
MTMPKISLHARILGSMFIGLAVGLGMYFGLDPEAALFQNAVWVFDLIGRDIFIGGLKMIIAPLILASIVTGIVSLPNARELGNVGVKTITYYVCTTTIAVVIGIVAVLVVRPGEKAASLSVREQRAAVIAEYETQFREQSGLDPETAEGRGAFAAYIAQREGEGLGTSDFATNWSRIQSTEERGALDMLRQEIVGPILTNPFNALAQNPPNALGIIFFAMLLGLACVIIGESARPVARFFEALNDVMMKITLWIMEIAPIGVGCIMASLVATLGTDALQSLAWYSATVVGGIGVHICVLLLIVSLIGRMSPAKFLYGIRDAWLIAFTTTSSSATLPVTIHCTTEKLGASEKVSRFALPVGATITWTAPRSTRASR